MVSLLGRYTNGNYTVAVYDDGTKVRYGRSDEFVPEKPESMDLKITNQCDMGCPMCHENSTDYGAHGDILNLPFLDTLNPYTEIAIGGGNPLSHPDLDDFLVGLKRRNLIANMTVNQKHFMDNLERLSALCDKKLIYGLGVSLADTPHSDFIEAFTKFPTAVLHVINGMVSPMTLIRLKDRGFKVLMLGYKKFRRGGDYYAAHDESVKRTMQVTYDMLPNMVNGFDVMSFDNLAIKQLNVRRLMSEDEWKTFYMGDDGTFAMYVDAVNWEFAASSVSTRRHDITSDIADMFAVVKEERNEP